MRSEEINELAVALVLAQGEFGAIPKDSVNPFFNSKYADLATVVKTTSPILVKHGLAVSQFVSHRIEHFSDGHTGGIDTLTTYLIHKSGQYISDVMQLHLVKDDPQAQGSAISYARRYSYMSALGLVADVDDDAVGASSPITAPAPVATTQTTVYSSQPKKTYPYKPKVDVVPTEADIAETDVEGIDKAFNDALNDLDMSITDATTAQLTNAMKLKGFTDKKQVVDIINEMSRLEWGEPYFMRLNEANAKVLLKRLNQPAVTKESLLTLIMPPPLTDADDPFLD